MPNLFLFHTLFDPSSLKLIFVNEIIKKYSRQSQIILVRRTNCSLLAADHRGDR
jgi:hypothetical protein